MKTSVKNILAIALSLSLALTSGGVCVAKSGEDTVDRMSDSLLSSVNDGADLINTVSEEKEQEAPSDDIKNLNDDEVVYVFADSTGAVNKVMDSIYIGNDEDSVMPDAADLPVAVSIKYELNGRSVSAEELEGKSGHITAELEFDNKQFEMREINGREEKIYVPFMVGAVTALDGKDYSNVTVSNGRVVYDGARYAVIGVAVPGLKEDLGEDAKTLEIPDSIKIEADVTGYKGMGLYLVVSNELFSDLSWEATDDMEKLKDDLSKIDDAMDALIDGSSRLYDGLDELSQGADKLSDGVSTLTFGLGQIDENSDDLVSGAYQVFNTLLATASEQLSASGVNVGTLTVDNYASVLEGAVSSGAVKNIAYKEVESQVNANSETIKAAVTDAVNAQVADTIEKEAANMVKEGVKQAVKEQVTEQVTAAVKENVKAQVAAAVAENYGITPEQALADPTASAVIEQTVNAKMESEEILATIDETVNSKMATPEIGALIDQNTAAQLATPEVKAQIEATKQEKLSSSEVASIINAKTQETINAKICEYESSPEVQGKISEGDQKILGLKRSLDEYNTFYQGIIAYTNGVGQAYDGAKKINASMPELVQGVKALRTGAGELNDGLNKFNDEGIVKINDLVNTTLEGMIDRFDTVKEVSRDYASFTSEDEAGKGGVKFIYKIASDSRSEQ